MNTAKLSFLIMALSLSLLPMAARGDLVAVLDASRDTTIYQDAANANNLGGGGAAGIYSGATNSSLKRRGLLAFDIAAGVPAGSTITGVELRMYLATSASSTLSASFGLHTLSKDWGEGTAGSSQLTVSGSGGGFAANTGDATWGDAKKGSVPWSNVGATGDFNVSASATTLVLTTNELPYTWSSPQLIADAQGWLDAPATNFGWALINASEGTNGSVKAFYSRSATQNSSNTANSLDLTWRPRLTVTYVPEPSTATLSLIIGMLPLLRRR